MGNPTCSVLLLWDCSDDDAPGDVPSHYHGSAEPPGGERVLHAPLNLWNSSLHQGDGVKKAEAIRVDPLLEGSLVHQATQNERGDEQRVDCLDAPNGLVAAQRMIDEPVIDVSLINSDFNLPPFVVGGHHFSGGSNPRVQKRGDHAMHFVRASAGGMLFVPRPIRQGIVNLLSELKSFTEKKDKRKSRS